MEEYPSKTTTSKSTSHPHSKNQQVDRRSAAHDPHQLRDHRAPTSSSTHPSTDSHHHLPSSSHHPRDHLDSIQQRSYSPARDQYLTLRRVSIDLINQAIALLSDVITTDELLTTVSDLVPGSTVGKHLRHLHDHFRLLFESSLADRPPHDGERKVLNYDSRRRNVPMESSRTIMIQQFVDLKRNYLENPSSACNRDRPGPNPTQARELVAQPLDQRDSFDHNLPLDLIAITPRPVLLKTTFNRELWFACLHATHHYALIRVIVTGELKLSLPKEFGVAPSTLERSAKI